MINHVWTVVCSKSVVDKETNNVSLLEVIEQLTFEGPEEPKQVTNLPFLGEIVSLWSRAQKDENPLGTGKIVIEDNAGAGIGEVEFQIDLREFQRARTILKFNAMPFKASGTQVFHIQYKFGGADEWKTAAKVPVEMTFKVVEVPQSELVNK